MWSRFTTVTVLGFIWKTTATDLNWYAPNSTQINTLKDVLNSNGVYGFIFNSSTTPSTLPYSTYNWCNMPHVRKTEYVVPEGYDLKYVEVIHRHHKRTPYQSNTFPVENVPWLCDASLHYFGTPDGRSADIAWSIQQDPYNPFTPSGFQNSTCQFPQITSGGLSDSRQHGKDLYDVYSSLGLLSNSSDVEFYVTNNVITSQVAGQVAIGMFPDLDYKQVKVVVQPAGVDSLEPQYSCPTASDLYSSYGVGSNDSAWLAHLNASQTVQLFKDLDDISGVDPEDEGWHQWFDHYFDNLSANLCHDRALPCNVNDSSSCVTMDEADAVFRRGLYEYSYIYRDNVNSLNASVGSYGVWVAQVVSNMRDAITGCDGVAYRHNVAHDGSISRLLSILQIDVMVWPGMGSEVVFELWQQKTSQAWYLRVLWKGQVLRSSNPSLGAMDMIPVSRLFDYVDGLTGQHASKLLAICQ